MGKRTLTALLLCTLPLAGQGIATPSSQYQSLVIGPGDLLHIQVYDTPQLEQHPRVDDAGEVPLLFLGNIVVLGDTPSQAAIAIQDRMVSGGLMRHPQVSVTVDQYATQDVSIIGQVNKPGNYSIETPRSIWEVLSMAGGLTALADRSVQVRRRDPHAKPVSYFVSNSPDKDRDTSPKIFPGDTIIVSKVELVYVLGDVARPGGYPMTSNDSPVTLLQTLAESGSANKTASLAGTKLLRKTQGTYSVVPVDISAMQRGKAPDIVLQCDDVLFIPFSYMKNFLLNGSAVAASVATAAVWIH